MLLLRSPETESDDPKFLPAIDAVFADCRLESSYGFPYDRREYRVDPRHRK